MNHFGYWSISPDYFKLRAGCQRTRFKASPDFVSVRPHMRRAHSHLYWTGAGRKQPRVKFLLPISVRGGALVEEPEESQVTLMR
jgi:hypothetical protein